MYILTAYFYDIIENGDLFVWGINDNGELGIGKVNEINIPKRLDLGFGISFVSCGYYHTAIISG
jgi:X-linked retinitis pigmentosa GTPase regulator